jgi:hypothetical protein
VNEDVTLKASGITSVRLVDPVEVELKSSKNGLGLSAVLKQVPHIEVDGKSLRFYTDSNAKMRRVAPTDYELKNATSPNSIDHHSHYSIELTPNNPLMPCIFLFETQITRSKTKVVVHKYNFIVL